MSSPTKSFLFGLPFFAKHKLIGLLDYEIRFGIGECSKRAKSLINDKPISYDLLEIYVIHNKIRLELIEDDETIRNFEFEQMSDDRCKRLDKTSLTKVILNGNYIQNAVKEIEKIFANGNVMFNEMNICVEEHDKDQRNLFLSSLKTVFESCDKQLSVKSFEHELSGYGEQLLLFLPFLKPGTLETINLDGSLTDWKDVLKLEQWKQAQSIWTRYAAYITIESFWNIPKFSMDWPVKVDELKTLIEHYLESKTFVRGSFRSLFNYNNIICFFDSAHSYDRDTGIHTFRGERDQVIYVRNINNNILIGRNIDFN